jgi:peptidoglycan/LPS O-acetylase OafA/YrhL
MEKLRLTTSESVLLDIIRVTAAAAVAFGHLTQPYFSSSGRDMTAIAFYAVAVFFMLSGFVIRYVTCRNSGTLGRFLTDRASRMYSVIIPALLLTIVADSISQHFNPGFYSNWKSSSTNPFIAILANLVFCAQTWFHSIPPLSDGPFWSVNCEVVYYLLYACWFYLKGSSRWLLIGAISLFFGPGVLYLGLLWVFGCVLHDVYQDWQQEGPRSYRLTWLTLSGMCVAAVFFLKMREFGRSSKAIYTSGWERHVLLANLKPGAILFGIFWAVIFLGLLLLARRFVLSSKSAFVRSVRFLAEGTFPIYLFHFPIFILIASCIPYNHASLGQRLLIFVGVFTVGVLAGHPCKLFKNRLRARWAHLHLRNTSPCTPIMQRKDLS